jgi:hypothetical protein
MNLGNKHDQFAADTTAFMASFLHSRHLEVPFLSFLHLKVPSSKIRVWKIDPTSAGFIGDDMQ